MHRVGDAERAGHRADGVCLHVEYEAVETGRGRDWDWPGSLAGGAGEAAQGEFHGAPEIRTGKSNQAEVGGKGSQWTCGVADAEQQIA